MAAGLKLFLGSDHAGLGLKRQLAERLKKELPEVKFDDLGTHDETSADYPDYAQRVAGRVQAGDGRGVLVCGSGIGMSIAANRFPNVRAALAWDATSARLSREHNDSNVLCLGARLIGSEVAWEALRIWLTTPFQGGRHQGRVEKIEKR